MSAQIDVIAKLLAPYNKFAVCLSGGIDSTLLLHITAKLYPQKVCAVTVLSPTLAISERQRIDAICQELRVQHSYIQVDELANADFAKNDELRCYYCKKERINVLWQWAQQNNIDILLDGSNMDDLADYRPGMQAMKESSATLASPFLEAKMDKKAIRAMAKEYNISFWDLPSSACLASRIACDLPITPERLAQVEQAEEFLSAILPLPIRVRHHGDIARIEILPENMAKIDNSSRVNISKKLKQLGFRYVTLDLDGYKMGSVSKPADNK